MSVESAIPPRRPRVVPSLVNSTHTFILSQTAHSELMLCELPRDSTADPSRQRRAHRKSRTGCENCKRRRIKCNEEMPCASCTRRGERCQRLTRTNKAAPASLVPSMPSQALTTFLPASESPGTAAKRLFHHFQAHTCRTLFATPEVWNQALPLCFQFEFLMSTVLCVAARHLSILRPGDNNYSAAAARHLSRALQQFRDGLSNRFESIHTDAVLATTILLQYELWTSTDFLSPQDDGVVLFDPVRDQFFAQSASMKQMFLHISSLASKRPRQASIFQPHLPRDATSALAGAAKISNTTAVRYQNFFAYHRPLNVELLAVPLPYTRGTDLATLEHHEYVVLDELDPIDEGYALVVNRICILLSYLPEAKPLATVDAESPLLTQLAACVFTFPIVCRGPFASMVHQSDPHALLLLYHFYRATRILLSSNQYWWAHTRAAAAEASLKEWLVRESARQAAASCWSALD